MNSGRGISGIVLAGGKGIRLGRNKGLAMLRGRHLIEYVIENLTQVCDEILISSNTEQCKKFGYEVIPDKYQAKGPLSGIHACLSASSNQHNFIISVDTPFINPKFISYMVDKKGESWISAPLHENGHYEPLSAYYNKQAATIIEEQILKSRYKLTDLFQKLPFKAVPINEQNPGYHPLLFHNINTQADLDLAEKYLEELKRHG